ncbi:MAG: FKBP-type peptidyl-prolyl cis-trans isomerase [Nanoarchaeota archaeon]|nr:FKBP-type peptidyl-prolyl cis-trans isomerase [Nanoarchaeota archaeon]
MTEAKKGKFYELKYTGYAQGDIFDSNIPEDLKVLDPEGKTKPQKTIIVLGEKMLVPGLDAQLEGKEIGKEYNLEIKMKDGFGPRDRNMLRTIPLKAFTEQKVNPQPGMMFTIDNAMVKIIAVSGARVTADFNNPLSGKDLEYKITITREVTDDKEKSETLLMLFFRFAPEFEIKEKKCVVKGPEVLKQMLDVYKDKFREMSGLELDFKLEKKKPSTDKKEEPSKKENEPTPKTA